MATLKDIAARAGVNISTVSRALNKNSEISSETRNHILRIAEELQYQPNLVAQTLAGKRSRLIGVLIPDIRSSYFDTVVNDLEAFLRAESYSTLLAITNFDFQREIEALELFASRHVDGILVTLPTNDKLLPFLDKIRERQGVPVVFLEALKQYEQFDGVMIDDIHGMAAAVKHLREKGHSQIGFVTDENNYSIRFPMFKRALAAHSVEFDPKSVHVSPERFEKAGYDAMKHLLASPVRPTAVLAGYDNIAIGAMRAIYEAGLRIPQDFAIIGNDNIPESSYLYQSLTTLAPPVHEMARLATQFILQRIREPENTTIHHVNLLPKLIIRETT